MDESMFPEKKKKKRRKPAKLPIDEFPSLFDTPPDHLKGIVRSKDYKTSIEAADNAARAGSRLENEILEAFRKYGPMTDGDLEILDELQWVAVSNSIRRTRSKLLKDGKVEPTLDKRLHPNSGSKVKMTVWRIK